MNGIIGRKVGMTQVFNQESGAQIAVTIIEAGPCVVLQRKTEETDDYSAVQLGFLDQKNQRLDKPTQGHFKKAGASAKRIIREVRCSEETEANPGDVVDASIFDGVEFIDVTGTSKGRGFQGVVKRHNFRGGRKTHGGHMHRRGGSIGQCVSPARVMKGRKMPGHMGARQVTTQNLRIVEVRPEDNAILVRGAVPGPNGGIVIVKKARKKIHPDPPPKAAKEENKEDS